MQGCDHCLGQRPCVTVSSDHGVNRRNKSRWKTAFERVCVRSPTAQQTLSASCRMPPSQTLLQHNSEREDVRVTGKLLERSGLLGRHISLCSPGLTCGRERLKGKVS